MTELEKARQDAAGAIRDATTIQLARALILRVAVKFIGAAVQRYAEAIGREDAALCRRGYEIECEQRFPLLRS